MQNTEGTESTKRGFARLGAGLIALLVVFTIAAIFIISRQDRSTDIELVPTAEQADPELSPLYVRWQAIEGVDSVMQINEEESLVSGEVCVADGYRTQQTAEALYAETHAFSGDDELGFRVTLEDSAGATEFAYEVQSGTWIESAISGQSCV